MQKLNRTLALILCTFLLLTLPPVYSESDPQLAATQDGGDDYLSRVCFFGDSTTHGLIVYNVQNNGQFGRNISTLKAENIWTPPDGTFYLANVTAAKIKLSDGRTLSLAEAAAEKRPDILIITVGINGMRTWTESEFVKYYSKLIETFMQASPETIVLLQSIYPTAKALAENLSGFTNDRIDRANTWVRALAVKYSLGYLNTAEVLKDAEGYLHDSYHNGDGMHLTTEGFNAVLSYIRTHTVN